MVTLRLPVPPIVHAPVFVAHIVKVWKDAKTSAEQMGLVLGDILKNINDEEIILCGHSLGARVIYSALIQISQQDPKINKKIIKQVHLLGGAIKCNSDNWNCASRCVEGKIYNYYSINDDILKYLYQILEINDPIGRNPIRAKCVVNKNVSQYVSGHKEYISNFENFVNTKT